MSDEVLVAIIAAVGVAVAAVAAALSAIGVAKISSTRTDVSEVRTDVAHARDQATAANSAAVQARELARPTGNGFANDVTTALARIESQVSDLSERQARTNEWLTRHLADHAQADVQRSAHPETEPDG